MTAADIRIEYGAIRKFGERVARFTRLRGAWMAATVIAGAAVSGCQGAEGTQPDLPTGFSVSFSPVVLPRGGSAQVEVTITRVPGFNGEVLVTGTSSLIGISVSSESVPANANTTTLKVTSDGVAASSSSTFLVSGISIGYKPVTTMGTLTLVTSGTFKFPAETTIDGIARTGANPGFTYKRKFSIARADYTLPVTFTAVSPAGFTTRMTPATTVGDSVELAVDIPASTPFGNYNVDITATGSDGLKVLKTITMNVRSPNFSVSAAPPVTPIARNEIGVSAVTILRDPGFTAPVEISLDPVDGITAEATTIPAGSSSLPFLLNVASFSPVGARELQVRGKSVGVADQTAVLHVDVGGFNLSVRTAPLAMAPGASAVDSVDITRTLFFDRIAIIGSAPAGITVRADSVSTGGNLAVLTVAVPSSVAAGTYSVTLTATGGRTIVTKTFSVEVSVPVTPTSPAIAVNPHTVSVSQGRTAAVSAVITNGLNVTDVTWTTKDASIATIAANGSRSVNVTGVKVGSSTYIVGSYAYSGGTARDSALVTVTAASTAQVDHITLDPDSVDVAKGQQVQYRVRFWNASNAEMNAEVGATISFSEDVSSVAQIDATTGLLTSRGVGSTPVTASYRMPYYSSLSPAKASLIAKAKVVVH